MRWAIFGLACFAGGFLTHGLQLEERECVPPEVVGHALGRVTLLEAAMLEMRVRQVELSVRALELEELCGRRAPASR